MMKIVTLGLLFCASALAKLDSYRNVLFGQAPLTQEVMNSLYADFKNEYQDSEVQKFIREKGGDRRAIFEANVKDIVSHNTGRD